MHIQRVLEVEIADRYSFLHPAPSASFFLPPPRSLFPPLRFSFLSEEKLAPSLALLERFPRTSNPILSREVSPRY